MTTLSKVTKDFFQLHTLYALTICPCDKYQFYRSQDRFDKFRSFWYEQLISLKKYEMFIEISHPHDRQLKGAQGPRLHLHGTITFETNKQLANFLLYKYRSLLQLSILEIDTVSDKKHWYKYCTKQTIFKNNRLASFS